jgi:hypothetical protein
VLQEQQRIRVKFGNDSPLKRDPEWTVEVKNFDR